MSLLRFLIYSVVAYVIWRYVRGWLASASQAQPRTEPPPPARESPYSILGVSRNASADEIRAAYQRLVMQYHPDRVSGLGPEIVAVAEAKTKELNEAYAQLKR